MGLALRTRPGCWADSPWPWPATRSAPRPLVPACLPPFPSTPQYNLVDYVDDLAEMEGRSPEEVVSILRRGSVGFARSARALPPCLVDQCLPTCVVEHCRPDWLAG